MDTRGPEMQPDAALLTLLKRWDIEEKAPLLPVETVRDLEEVFAVFDKSDLPDFLDLPPEKVGLICEHFENEKRLNKGTYDLKKLAGMASLDPDVIRDWNKRQLYLFGVSEFTPDMTQMFLCESTINDLKRSCLAWAQKKSDDEYRAL